MVKRKLNEGVGFCSNPSPEIMQSKRKVGLLLPTFYLESKDDMVLAVRCANFIIRDWTFDIHYSAGILDIESGMMNVKVASDIHALVSSRLFNKKGLDRILREVMGVREIQKFINIFTR